MRDLHDYEWASVSGAGRSPKPPKCKPKARKCKSKGSRSKGSRSKGSRSRC